MANSTTIQMVLKLLGDFSDVNSDISQLQQKLDKIKLPAKFKGNFDNIFSDLTKETTKYQKLLNSGFKTKGDVTGLEASGERINTLLQRLRAEMSKIDPTALAKTFEVDPSKIREANAEVEKVQKKLQSFMSGKDMDSAVTGVDKIVKAMADISKTKFAGSFLDSFKKGDIKGAEEALRRLKENITNFKEGSEKQGDYKVYLSGLETALNELKGNTALQDLIKQLAEVKSNAENIHDIELTKMLESFKEAGIDVSKLAQAFGTLDGETNRVAQSQHQFNSELDQLKNKVAYFFGISNAVNLLKRTIRESINTVKELDAVMTETAVVTDFTVGDMWEKLPHYAKQASKLGASIKDLYSATTLYYQQGLNSDQAMNVGVETMKMARIANMDAADATTAMTAALRGFNMEIDETSATRVNDVYSELAAITAADTSQIATAMGKTASIAASANMEFETTAALLAQIIETTQEAPETAGTAMKTIIARFTEVKELFSEGMLSGEDEEGEEININKIDAALKTVGISLKDFLNGTKGIDDIFLELASKWDTLDLATQRYIATTAAGSRQQSRFIAMMSNYDRTMELVTAANNSAGASQNQYEKTLESMEAKLQKLQNAWNTFVMNLANSDALKLGVDLLTGLINAVNGLTQALSGGTGLGKSLVTFMELFAIFKGGKALLGKAGNLLGIDLIKQIVGIFARAFTGLTGKKLESTGEGAVQSIFAGFERGIKANSFKKVFLDQVISEEDFKNAAKAASEQYGKILADPKIGEEAKKKYLEKKELLDKAAMGDRQAGEKAGIINANKLEKDLTGVASGAMLAGTAINLLGGTLSAIGWEEAGEPVSKFGTSVMSLGAAAAFAAPLLQTLGITITQLGWGIGIAAAVFTALPYVFNAIKAATPEGRLEAAKEATVQAGEAAESAASSFESLKSALDGIDSKFSNLDKMVSGTQQWKEAAHELNTEVADLIDRYPELAGYFEYKNGVMSKKSGADQEIERLLRQQEMDIQRTKQVQTQAKIEEQKREREILKDYNLQHAFQNPDLGGYAPTGYVQQMAMKAAQGETEEELAKIAAENNYIINVPIETLRSYGEILAADQSRYDSQLANNIKKQAEISGYTDSEIQEMDSNLISDIRENIYKSELQNLSKLEASDKDRFAEMYNYRREGDSYYNKETGQKIEDIDDNAIKTALASARADDATIAKIAAITQKTTQDSLSARVMSEDGVNLTYKNIQSILQKIGEGATIDNLGKLDMSQLGEALGIDIDAMAKELGIGAEELFENIKQNIRSASDRITDQRKDLVASMNKYSKVVKQDSKNTLSDLNANMLRQLEDSYGEGFRDTLENIFMSLQRSGDDAIVGAGYGNFITKAMQKGTDFAELESLSDFITNVDWASPIEAAYQLNQEIERGSGLSQEFAKNMMSIQQGYLGAGSQMRYLIESSDFEGIQEELDSILETSSEISASDVLDLVDSYASLNKMLKNTEASAAGVAKALQAVAEGDIKVDQLTDAVLASLSGFDGLNSMIAELQKKLEDFDPGIDENFASEFIAQASEVVNENLAKGAVGNSQIDKYFDLLFTENWDKDLVGEDRVKKIEELGTILKNNSENMSSFWDKIATDAKWQEALGDFKVSRNQSTGEITLSGYEGMSTDEQAAALVEASKSTGFEISETFARMLLTDFKNYSYDHEYNMATLEQDAKQIAENTLSELRTSGEQTYIDQSEIDSIKTLTGIDITSALQELTSNMLTITNFYKEDGTLKETQDLVAEMAKVQGYKDAEDYKRGFYDPSEGFKRYGDQYGDGKRIADNWKEGKLTNVEDVINMSAIEAQLAELRLPQEAKTQIAQDVADSFFAQEENKDKTLELDFIASDGSLQTLGLKAGDSVEQAIANRELEIKNEALAASIQKAFAESGPLPVKIEPNTEAVEGLDTNVTANLIPNMSQIDATLKNSNLTASVSLIPSLSWPYQHAKGIKNSPTTHDALVGEEGAELIERQDGTAYLSGLNGPEVTTIHAGDTVHTAEETKRIFSHNKGISIPRFENGLDSHGYKGAKRGTGSGGDKEDKESWENPFDKLYNLVRKIDEELRQRERIERRYEKLLESIDTSANKIIQVSREELAQLEKERMLQEKLIEGRKGQISDLIKENADLTKYANVTQNERGEDVLRINWDLIDAVTDTEEGEAIEEYVSQLEEWFDALTEAEDALWDIEDAVAEIKERGEDQYFDLESMIKDALIQSYQDEIDKLTEINNSINDTNASLLDAMQKTIDKQRQDRDNQRTEEDLAEKQRRLLYLQQDTSGANAMEILKLQDEIARGQEDYTDSLIDQKISELQEQNDEAAKQREQQITIAQAQLDYAIESGQLWNEIYSLMNEGLDPDGGLVRGSQLETLLKSSEGFKGMSVLSKMEWLNETNNLIAQALAYLELGRQLEDIGVKAGTEIEFTTADGKVLKGTVDDQGNVTAKDGQVYNNVYQGYDGKYYARENLKKVDEPKVEEPKPTPKPEPEQAKVEEPQKQTGYYYTINGSGTKYWNMAAAQAALAQIHAQIEASTKLTTVYGQKVDVAALKKQYAIQTHTYQYKKGGLADFTGPAWLDGTKSKPELVLNARDTENFIQLKNILGSLLNRSTTAPTENNGDITYDIDINVESIGSDYDVDQIANKIKSLINEDARYRNNNAVSLMR